jgi:hypothetical protein
VIVSDRQNEQKEFLEAHTKGKYELSMTRFIGLESNGKLVAVAGFDSYNGASMQVHLAITGRLTRKYIRYVYNYAFNTAKVYKLVGLVSSSNAKALKFDFHSGFIEEGRIVGGYPDGDIVILTMTREQCRYLDK